MENKANLRRLLKQDVLIVIDWANLFYAQKSLKAHIDVKKFITWLRTYRRIIDIRIYLGYNHEREKERSLVHLLRSLGCTVIAKPIKLLRKNGLVVAKKGNVDVELALDTWDRQNRFRTLFLFSGDSDFATLLKRLRRNHKRCVIASARTHTSKELIEQAHWVVRLEDVRDKICK